MLWLLKLAGEGGRCCCWIRLISASASGDRGRVPSSLTMEKPGELEPTFVGEKVKGEAILVN